ncbi:MAG: hypothetical protein KH135_02930 [Firmicutes bacterium]|nr:hypothetical protein [Bacillota bacterium]
MKKFGYAIFTFLGMILCITGVSAKSTPVLETEHVLNGNKNFFANGTEITVKAREDGQKGATITWDGGSMNVDEKTHIFGGSHESDEVLESTKITMNGGQVANVIGGGLHKSHVKKTTVIINGGTMTGVQGGGASSANWTDCHRPWYAQADESAINRVDEANVILNGGSSSLVFGGNEGMGYTGNANLTITGGTWGWVTSGGSNGYTKDATTTVKGGKITVLQTINRGKMNGASVEVQSGTIENAYVTGETGDDTVTGKIADVTMNIVGGTVKNLEAGRNNNQVVTEATTGLTTAVTYIEGTVLNDNTELKETPVVIKKHKVEIGTITNGTVVATPSDDVLKGTKINLEITANEGYKLDKLVVTTKDGNVVTVNDNSFVMPDDDVLVEATFIEVKDETIVENPNTHDGIVGYVALAFVGLGLIGYTAKKVFVK